MRLRGLQIFGNSGDVLNRLLRYFESLIHLRMRTGLICEKQSLRRALCKLISVLQTVRLLTLRSFLILSLLRNHVITKSDLA